MEQPGLEQELIRDAGLADDSLSLWNKMLVALSINLVNEIILCLSLWILANCISHLRIYTFLLGYQIYTHEIVCNTPLLFLYMGSIVMSLISDSSNFCLLFHF